MIIICTLVDSAIKIDGRNRKYELYMYIVQCTVPTSDINMLMRFRRTETFFQNKTRKFQARAILKAGVRCIPYYYCLCYFFFDQSELSVATPSSVLRTCLHSWWACNLRDSTSVRRKGKGVASWSRIYLEWNIWQLHDAVYRKYSIKSMAPQIIKNQIDHMAFAIVLCQV